MKYRNEDGYEDATTPLHQAASDGNIELVKSLLASGADPNKGQRSTDEDGDVNVGTPLYWAADGGYTEMVRILLASGARQDLDNGGGELG